MVNLSGELERLRQAIVRRDADAIEECVSGVSLMVEELERRLTMNREYEYESMHGLRLAAGECLALLRRGRATLQALENLHKLFSTESTYRVRG